MSKEVFLSLVLGFLFLIFSIIGKNEECYYGVALFWGLAAFLWLRNCWLDYRFQRRCKENERLVEDICNNAKRWFKEFEEFKERELDIADRIDADMWNIQFQELNRRLPNSNDALKWLEWFKGYKKMYGTKPSVDELRNMIHTFM